MAMATSGAMSFISVLLVRLGAPNWLIGLESSLPALVTILAVLPVGAFVQRQRNLATTAGWARLIFRIILSTFALLPLLPPSIASYVLVIGYGSTAIPGTVLQVSFTSLLGQATTPDRRPRMLSTRMAINGLAGAAIGFLAGQWLDFAPYPLNYQVLFLSTVIGGIGSFYTLSRLRLPSVPEKEIAKRRRASLKEMFQLIKDAPLFRNYSLAAFLFRFAMAMPQALYSIYRVRTLGASDAWIGILLTVERLVSVVAYFGLGRLLTRPNFRRRLWTSCIGMALFPFSMALVGTPEMLIIPSVIVGLFSAGMEIYLTDTLIQVSPGDQRPTFIAANAFLANVTTFVAPLIGTALADAIDIRIVLMLSAGLRAIGGLAFWRLRVGTESSPSTTSASS
ncbi:MAG: hypothetical protein A2Y73_07755 [Chloroflexi bacterium RBG_13_56_8]|nr:MAG: hypothetical protein A2Y73_07755 [Chloroflexi bacterium RBG_13_56_8]